MQGDIKSSAEKDSPLCVATAAASWERSALDGSWQLDDPGVCAALKKDVEGEALAMPPVETAGHVRRGPPVRPAPNLNDVTLQGVSEVHREPHANLVDRILEWTHSRSQPLEWALLGLCLSVWIACAHESLVGDALFEHFWPSCMDFVPPRCPVDLECFERMMQLIGWVGGACLRTSARYHDTGNKHASTSTRTLILLSLCLSFSLVFSVLLKSGELAFRLMTSSSQA